MTIDEERQKIREELDALRRNGARRQELSLHACKRLFFDLGIRPSMAAVRDLTQTGSASDIPKDIELFWQRIRSASQVRIGTGAIPPALETKAGDLLGALFEEALVQARIALDDERAQIQAEQVRADQQANEAQIRQNVTEAQLQRVEERAEAGWARVRDLEAQLAALTAQDAARHGELTATAGRLTAETAELRTRVDAEQAINAALRERIDVLQTELRANAEHYAQQIKDALAEAERRVKPMLVELDSLRSMASTWQNAQRDANRKEFDFLQQLSSAKARADRLDAQLRERTDEFDLLTRQLSALRSQQGMDADVSGVLAELAVSGRLDATEIARIGTTVDAYVALPPRCPACTDGEPELAEVGDGYELVCPECGHSSGDGRSRLEVVARFLAKTDQNAAHVMQRSKG